MQHEADRTHVRLAELVAALSLGIDLGFGQPMEHVLRQCLIALRLAERSGSTSEAARGRLLHRAAGQRRLPLRRPRAGEVVRRRHRARSRASTTTSSEEPRGRPLRACACSAPATRRCTGSGSASSSSLSGHREVDGMIEHHAAIARTLGEQLGLSARGRSTRSVASYERWDGRGWPGELEGEEVPDRGAGRAARRVRRGRAPRRRRRGGDASSPASGAAEQFDPALADLVLTPTATSILSRARRASATWDAVIDAEPALAVVARPASASTRRCSRSRTSST